MASCGHTMDFSIQAMFFFFFLGIEGLAGCGTTASNALKVLLAVWLSS